MRIGAFFAPCALVRTPVAFAFGDLDVFFSCGAASDDENPSFDRTESGSCERGRRGSSSSQRGVRRTKLRPRAVPQLRPRAQNAALTARLGRGGRGASTSKSRIMAVAKPVLEERP